MPSSYDLILKNGKCFIEGQLKINDILSIGFNDLSLKVINLKKKILCKVIKTGKLENNKGVHLKNRKIDLNIVYIFNNEATSHLLTQ